MKMETGDALCFTNDHSIFFMITQEPLDYITLLPMITSFYEASFIMLYVISYLKKFDTNYRRLIVYKSYMPQMGI